MIRAAKSTDAFALVNILKERFPETRYAGRCAIDELVARRMFAQAAQRNGGTTEGATFLMVSERNGEIEAFIMGALSRIYNVFDALAASDIFLIGRKDCDPRAMNRLIDQYLAWADGNPKVLEVSLSWADSIPGNETIMAAYGRRGFALCAQTFRRDTLRPILEDRGMSDTNHGRAV